MYYHRCRIDLFIELWFYSGTIDDHPDVTALNEIK